jgi:hypothetical protein
LERAPVGHDNAHAPLLGEQHGNTLLPVSSAASLSRPAGSRGESGVSAATERAALLAKRSRAQDTFRTQRIFHYFLLVFIIFRIAWFVVGVVDSMSNADTPDLLDFSLNRAA